MKKKLKLLVCKARIFVLLIILVLVDVIDNIIDLASQARVLFHGLFNTVYIIHNGGVVFFKLFADSHIAHTGYFPDHIKGNLAGVRYGCLLLGAVNFFLRDAGNPAYLVYHSLNGDR